MNKKMLALLNGINLKKSEIKALVEQGKLEEAKAAKKELQNMQDKFDILKDIEDVEVQGMQDKINKGGEKQVQDKDSTKEFADAARRGFVFVNAMTEGTPSEGGYTVPEDIQTRINTYREAKASLIDLVTVEHVSTNKGSRTYKKRNQQTGFTKVGEKGKIGAKGTPEFERIDYEVAKYAGYFPATNELLEDTDANIVQTLIAWIGDESRVTRNKIILEVINGKEKTAMQGLDDIKKALNVTLGQAFKATSRLVTNDDGLQYLDTLKDTEGKYILQPNPANPMEMVVCAGATRIPVFVVPNSDMPSDTKTAKQRKIPMIIGDLKEAITFFDRKALTITTSNTAVAGELNAFEEDMTLFRAIEREDCKAKDLEAIVNGEITITDETVTGAARRK